MATDKRPTSPTIVCSPPSDPYAEDEQLEARIRSLRAKMEVPNSPMTRFQTMRPVYLAMDRINQLRERREREYQQQQNARGEQQQRTHKQEDNSSEPESPYTEPRGNIKSMTSIVVQGNMHVEAWYTFQHIRKAFSKLYTILVEYMSSLVVARWIIFVYTLLWTVVNECRGYDSSEDRRDRVVSTQVENGDENRRTTDDDDDPQRTQNKRQLAPASVTEQCGVGSIDSSKNESNGKSIGRKSISSGRDDVSSPQPVRLLSTKPLEVEAVEWFPSGLNVGARDLGIDVCVREQERVPSAISSHNTTWLSANFLTGVSVTPLDVSASSHSAGLDSDEGLAPGTAAAPSRPHRLVLASKPPRAPQRPTPPIVQHAPSSLSSEPSTPRANGTRKGTKVLKVVHRIQSVLKRVGSTATTFSRQSSNNDNDPQYASASFSVTDAALIDSNQVLTRRQASRARARFAHTFHSIHTPADVSHRIFCLLRSRNFGCQATCNAKKWANAFKMRVVSLKRLENSTLVVRIVVEPNKSGADGTRGKDLGSSVTIYPARVGSFKGDADLDDDTLAIAHYNEFVASVEDAFKLGCNGDEHFE